MTVVAWNNPFITKCGWKMCREKEKICNFLFIRKHLWMIFMIFFQAEMVVFMDWKSVIEVSSSFFYILTRQVGQWVPKK